MLPCFRLPDENDERIAQWWRLAEAIDPFLPCILPDVEGERLQGAPLREAQEEYLAAAQEGSARELLEDWKPGYPHHHYRWYAIFPTFDPRRIERPELAPLDGQGAFEVTLSGARRYRFAEDGSWRALSPVGDRSCLGELAERLAEDYGPAVFRPDEGGGVWAGL